MIIITYGHRVIIHTAVKFQNLQVGLLYWKRKYSTVEAPEDVSYCYLG